MSAKTGETTALLFLCKDLAGMVEDVVHFIVDSYSKIHQEFLSTDANGVSSEQICVGIFKSRKMPYCWI